ncbi:methyl-accepting chemotaxis protein [Pseudomonas sp. RIT-PI-AD]|uniref:methyl-accepting chemotaxis protein n=1 Tax=Pseudomonas sp. RIT-PI-AD TaxID=3035294 RepID=UPI0021DACA59|nr:methyl-accepting chemotaxis protein [Pseudomonas sp. RIT-PI-AD]
MFRQIKTAQRTLLCFGLMIAMLIGLGAFCLVQMAGIQKAVEVIQKESMPSMATGDALGLNLSRLRSTSLQLHTFTEPDEFAKYSGNFDMLTRKIEQDLRDYGAVADTAAEKAALAQVAEAYQAYKKGMLQEIALEREQRRDEALAVLRGLTQYSTTMNDQTALLASLNLAEAEEASADAVTTYDHALKGTLAMLVLALVVSLLLSWRFSRSIIGPLRDALAVAQRIARNDLTGRVQAQGSDEAAQLLLALGTMQSNLRGTVSEIESSSNQLAAAAEEMSAVMEESTRGLQQQNDEIDLAVTAVTEMSAAVDEVAANAVGTSEESQASTRIAQQGQEQLRDAVVSIKTLVDNVLEASRHAEELAEQTGNISKMLDVIRAVADQTNLLALNAAIEAARAGEAGRGFAVVADEVRALAHRTGESTREIESMIGTIQKGTGQTVEALQHSANQATQTLGKASAAGDALEAINKAVGGINERNLVIASAAEEQAQVAREVDRNLVRIRDLSSQTAAGAEETNAASNELSRLANGLNAMLGRFSL